MTKRQGRRAPTPAQHGATASEQTQSQAHRFPEGGLFGGRGAGAAHNRHGAREEAGKAEGPAQTFLPAPSFPALTRTAPPPAEPRPQSEGGPGQASTELAGEYTYPRARHSRRGEVYIAGEGHLRWIRFDDPQEVKNEVDEVELAV